MRTSSWANVGTDIINLSQKARLKDALVQANLNYEVSKENIMTPSGLIVPNKCATVKTYSDGTKEVAGVVGSNYEVCQNWDAFNFVDNLVDEGVEIIKAGETYSGMVYLIGQMPEVTVLGDTFRPNIIFQNSHNGTKLLSATLCMLRIVCQNQFASTFKDADNAIKIHHTKSMENRLVLAHEVLHDAFEYIKKFGNDAEKLAEMKISTYAINKAFDEFIGIAKANQTERMKRTLEEEKAQFAKALKVDDNANFKNTMWGAVNAFADYLTHKEGKATKTYDERHFVDVSTGDATEKFVNILRAVA